MFQPITEDLLDIALEILNSNTHHNILENRKPARSIEEVRNEFLNPNTESYLIFLENKYIGIVNFLKNSGLHWVLSFMQISIGRKRQLNVLKNS